jgi:hypothetical protein
MRAWLNLVAPEPTRGAMELARSFAPMENAMRAETARPATIKPSVFHTKCIALRSYLKH